MQYNMLYRKLFHLFSLLNRCKNGINAQGVNINKKKYINKNKYLHPARVQNSERQKLHKQSG